MRWQWLMRSDGRGSRRRAALLWFGCSDGLRHGCGWVSVRGLGRCVGRAMVRLAASAAGSGTRFATSIAAVVSVLVLSSCGFSAAQRSTLAQTGIGVPAQWTSPGPADGEATGPTSANEAWVADLGTPELTALIEEALGRNFGLRRVSARARAAHARARVAGARLKPRVDGEGSASRTGTPAEDDTRSNVSSFDAVLSGSWEVDLWDRLSGEARASSLDASAAVADYVGARLSVAADVGQAWFDAIEATLQVALAEETVGNFRDNLGVVENGFELGLNGALDVRLERANLATAESRVEARRITEDAALRLVETLLGRYPGAKLEVSAELNAPSVDVPAGLPAELLARRPDIQAAARRLAAADARFDVARKNWLPRVVLTARGGVTSMELENLLDFDALLWSLASTLTAPIFRAGELQAERDIAQADVDEALAAYAQAVLTAFREVESALVSEQLLESQEEALRVAARESEEAASLALERYRVGLVDIVTWLDARNRTFDAKSALLTTSNERLQNRIALYLALGGGFGSASISDSAAPAVPDGSGT
ncbi:MAG: efflux transporter outer membrane subunit [Gammaproteobacteria bacterium]